MSPAWSFTACFAANEAALKALGLGLLDGGLFEAEPDSCPGSISEEAGEP
jgi:hypothetical protein